MRLRTPIKRRYHRLIDPWLANRKSTAIRQELSQLADGDYCVSFHVPYVPQFASPEHINEYIHHKFNGLQDSRWQEFGADNVEDYAFWAPRVCALACLKMAIHALNTVPAKPSLWQLVQDGLDLGGYRLFDDKGNWVDVGWYVNAQIVLAERYGIQMTGHPQSSPFQIAHAIYQGKLTAATVSPELGERDPDYQRFGGHLVIVWGFRMMDGLISHFLVNNPSGRYPELQDNAWISAKRFARLFAYRFATYEPVATSKTKTTEIIIPAAV